MTPNRTTDAACPAWCAGHDDELDQAWEDLPDGTMIRLHSSEYPEVAGQVGVNLRAEELTGSGSPAPVVSLFFADGEQTLTAEEARRVAASLLLAADALDEAQR